VNMFSSVKESTGTVFVVKKVELYLSYEDYETRWSTNHSRWYRCLDLCGLCKEGNSSTPVQPVVL